MEGYALEEHTLKHHFLTQLLHHHQGVSQEDLVQKTSDSAGMHPDEHRGNILDWINFLVTTGHLKRRGDTITPADIARLEKVHKMREQTHDMWAAQAVDPRLMEFFGPH